MGRGGGTADGDADRGGEGEGGITSNNASPLQSLQKHKGLNKVMSFLGGPKCSLFSNNAGVIEIRVNDIDNLFEKGMAGKKTAMFLKQLQKDGRKFANFDECVEAVRLMNLQKKEGSAAVDKKTNGGGGGSGGGGGGGDGGGGGGGDAASKAAGVKETNGPVGMCE